MGEDMCHLGEEAYDRVEIRQIGDDRGMSSTRWQGPMRRYILGIRGPATFTSSLSPPTTPPLPAAMLDSSAYPHILDGVVDHAAPETLLALRATCRSVRVRADSHLARHVVLRDDVLSPFPGTPKVPVHLWLY